jgi:calpain-7
LPISKLNEPICTFSKFRGELWPSIIEKAYMKLMGGYAFPGSNSSIDLHALTGWIPELILFKVDSFDKETQWLRLRDGHIYGDALITVATGPEEEDLLDDMGLVPAHAYAVLDLRELYGLRVLKIKNPWSHCRWKGRLSHLDREYWTPELLEELEYDLLKAQEKDDGVFWILYEDLLEYFECFNVNWNPELFPHSQVIHTRWKTDKGPKKDTYNIGYNPQFSLRVNGVSETETTPVWVLITKHRLKTEVNQQYFALHVYEDNGGQSASYRMSNRVHYPDSPLIRVININYLIIITNFVLLGFIR